MYICTLNLRVRALTPPQGRSPGQERPVRACSLSMEKSAGNGRIVFKTILCQIIRNTPLHLGGQLEQISKGLIPSFAYLVGNTPTISTSKMASSTFGGLVRNR